MDKFLHQAGQTVVAGTFAVATAVAGVADKALDFVIPPAGAETLTASAVQAAPVTQQVLDEIQAANPKSFKFFDRLSPEGKNSVASFYQKFKEADPKNLSEAVRQMTYLQSGYEINKQALSDLQKDGRISGEGIEDPSDPIKALLGMLPPNTQIGQAFGQFFSQAEWAFKQAKTLQDKFAAARGDSEALKKAKLELAATKVALKKSEDELAQAQATLRTLQTINRKIPN